MMEIISQSYPIKKNDKVMVIAGKEKGKSGKVLRVIPKKAQLIIEKINFVKRHTRATKKAPQGGIIEKEAPVHISNVMFFCGKCNSPVRIGHKLLEDGSKVRVCRKCGETIES